MSDYTIGVALEIDEALDLDAMTRLSAADATLREVATEARERLVAALAALEGAR